MVDRQLYSPTSSQLTLDFLCNESLTRCVCVCLLRGATGSGGGIEWGNEGKSLFEPDLP